MGAALRDIIVGDLSKTGIRGAMGIPLVGDMVSEMLGMVAKVSKVGLAFTVALGAVITGAKAVAATFNFLDNAAAGLTETLAEMSPSIMVTRMRNELLQFADRMRMAGTVGPIMAAREEALGRLERSMYRLGSIVGVFGAKLLTPLYNVLADILEALERIMGMAQAVVRAMSTIYGIIGRSLLPFMPSLGMGYLGVSGVLGTLANSMTQIARNTNPVYQGNQPFIDDLRLMGARI